LTEASNYRPVAVATVVSKQLNNSLYLASLHSLEPQTIHLVSRLVMVGLLTNVHFLLKQTLSYFVTHEMCVRRMQNRMELFSSGAKL